MAYNPDITRTVQPSPVDFITSLADIAIKQAGSSAISADPTNGVVAVIIPNTTDRANFFAGLTQSVLLQSGNTPYQNFLNYTAQFNIPSFGPLGSANANLMANGLIADYANQLQLTNANEATIWASLTPPLNPSTASIPYNFDLSNDPNVKTQFIQWFNYFAEHYPYGAGGGVGTENNFFSAIDTSMSSTAVLGNTSHVTTPSGTLPSYEGVFKAFFPSSTTADFVSYLQNFYAQSVQSNGYFIPSQSFPTFINQVQYDYMQAQGPGILTPASNLASADFNLTAILDRIYALIKDMLGTMQNIAAVQANRLTVLTNWQQAYTVELTQLKTFLAADLIHGLPSYLTQSDLDHLNDLNSTYRQQVTTNQSVVSDDAKSLQSNINQSTDAVTQQANMATSIIQELSTLLGAIYR